MKVRVNKILTFFLPRKKLDKVHLMFTTILGYARRENLESKVLFLPFSLKFPSRAKQQKEAYFFFSFLFSFSFFFHFCLRENKA